MRVNTLLLAFLGAMVFAMVPAKAFSELVLVKSGRANSVIVVPSSMNDMQQVAIDDFCRTIKRTSSAEIRVVTEAEAEALPKEMVRIVIGPGALAEKLGFSDDLKLEEFRIVTVGNAIVVLAKDIERGLRQRDSMVTTWALSHILEYYVGVRWLWPGELGTVVPKREIIAVPNLDVRRQPKLVTRRLRIQNKPDVKLWTAHHQVAGMRKSYKFMHSFRERGVNGDWWGRFHESKPEMLAKDPEGNVGYPNGRPHFVKICISNPDVTAEVVRLWEAAGAPDYWDVTPNDGNAFCTCDNCRALDKEYGDVEYTKEEIWRRPDHVVLTDRYVWFWNQLVRTMRKKNPKVVIGASFYSAYRTPPKKLKLEDGIVGTMVHGFDFANWEAWKEAGAQAIALRPNWWHMGACAPHLPLHMAGDYIERARAQDMLLINMDTLREFWATQGPYYYLVARLIGRPDMDTEAIIAEYCDAFGKASKSIRAYLDYWEDYHKGVAYNIPAGGKLSQDPNGLYERVSKEQFGSVQHPLRGHWKTLQWIYPPEVLAKGYAILDMAEEQAGDEDVRLRIQFLRDGLVQVERTIDFMKAESEAKEEALANLVQFSRSIKAKYGYWGEDGIGVMKYWGIIGKEMDIEGM